MTLVSQYCVGCGAAVTGRYCADCGEHTEPHDYSMKHFVAEVLETTRTSMDACSAASGRY